MTELLPPDPEKDPQFVKIYLQTGDALDAYTRCRYQAHGYEARTAAAWLLERADIQLALKTAEMLKPKAPVDITRESIVSDLENIHARAVAESDYTPAIAAKKLQAQLSGYLAENVTIMHRLDITAMSDAEIMKHLTKNAKHIDGEFAEVAPKGLGQISVSN